MQPTAIGQAYPFFRDPWKGLKYNVLFPRTRAGRVIDLIYLPVDLFSITASAWDCAAFYVVGPILGHLAWILFLVARSFVLILGAMSLVFVLAVIVTACVVNERV
jgi:hypothetical protein